MRTMVRRARGLVLAAGELFPFTPLGLIAMSAAGFAMWRYGVRRIDLVLLIVGAVALAVGALASVVTVTTAVVLALRLRRLPGGASVQMECGFPSRTGFSLSNLWYVPLVKVRWSWEQPAARVRLIPQRRRLHEEITPHRRGVYDRVVRRFEVGDAFGLTRIVFRVAEPRAVRLWPSVGALKRVNVVRSIASGDDLPHPGGQPEGERADLRRYAAGDPVRFVLWKVFARNRQLVVRTPERAISPARRTYAYLVAAESDEAAAGTARVAVETGALGASWVLGADGSEDAASTRAQALEVLARSARCPIERSGAGLGAFLARHAAGGAGRVVVFVPAVPGPWLSRVVSAARAHVSPHTRLSPVEFVVCVDGVIRPAKSSWLARLALAPTPAERSLPDGEPAPSPAASIVAVLDALSATRAGMLLVDRRAGRVYTEGHRRALEAA